MSAIRSFLEVARIVADTGYPGAKGWLAQIDAAEVELKELRDDFDDLNVRYGDVNQALEKINAIRNSIVGTQSLNWSEHAYPLVAALNEAGIKGLPYPEARANVGTLLERIAALEHQVAERERRDAELLEAYLALNNARGEFAATARVHFNAVVARWAAAKGGGK